MTTPSDELYWALKAMVEHDNDQRDMCADWGTNPCLIRERGRRALKDYLTPVMPELSRDDWATLRDALLCTIDDYAYRAEYASMTSTDTDELKGYLDAKQRYVELLTRLERTR